MTGYHHSVWKIDLSRGTAARVGIAAELFPRVIGGVGLGTWLLLQECPAGADPFDPACPLVFAWAPLAGTGLPGADRFAVVSKSPLTGRLNDATCSSAFAVTGKGTGTDALVILGRCAELSVLIVEPRGARAEPWPELAGLSAEAAAAQVRERLGEHFRVAAIGPAGERGVRYATLSAEGRHAGRGGTGAVMGAKRLKAIAVAGEDFPEPAEPERLAALAAIWRGQAASSEMARYRERGTLGTLADLERRGLLPARNFQPGAVPGAAGLHAERFAEGSGIAQALPPGALALETRATGADGRSGRMEYENVFSLGPLCGIAERETVQAAVARCDAYGLDTISAGATLAFLMECRERCLDGVPNELRALNLRFGEGASVLAALDALGQDTPAGRLLGEGTRRLAARIGGGSADFAPHVKGLELPGYDPRTLPALGLALAVGARGADHNKASAYDADLREGAAVALDDAAVQAVIEGEERAVLWDSLILSKFLRRTLRDDDSLAELLHAITGNARTGAELRESARHVLDLKKRFNAAQGWTAAEDTLPARFFRAENGHAGLAAEDFAKAVRSYYGARGWDEQGQLPAGPDDREG